MSIYWSIFCGIYSHQSFRCRRKKKWAEIKTKIVYLTKTENETLSDFLTICMYLLVVPRDAVIVMQKQKKGKKAHSSVSDVLFKLRFVFRYIQPIKKIVCFANRQMQKAKVFSIFRWISPPSRANTNNVIFMFACFAIFLSFVRSFTCSGSRSHNQYALRYSYNNHEKK